MVDTLVDKEYIIINKLTYIIGKPHRGDVVVFRPPNDASKYYVKRIIGEPGDTVVIEDGYVFLKKEGESELHKLDESAYLTPQNLGHTFRHPPNSGDTTRMEYNVSADHYFVLGDNRMGSLDSRSFTVDSKSVPTIARSEIKGRVWFVALPITKIHALELPSYGF